ncbi:MAG: PQQ-dependent sugar dehydrogenase [Solirubrobacteraceae bacterium]
MRRLLAVAVALALPASAGAAIRVPAGVKVSTRVAGVPYPTNIAFDPAGGVWITSSAGGDQATDGVWYAPRGARRARHVIKGIHLVLGLTWYRGVLYVSHAPTPSTGRVSAYAKFSHGRFSSRRVVIPKLRIGLHAVDTIVPGFDNRLYVGAGSVSDHSGYPGRVVSVHPDGSGLRREAVGLRNPYGLAFVPGTSRLLVTDNGRDDLGPFRPPEELNVFDVAGGTVDFGFPGCFNQGGAACRGKIGALVQLPAHASADGLAVTEDWAGGGLTAFIAQNGSSYSANPTGHDIRIVRLGVRAETVRSKARFASGFRHSDPLGAAIGPDGSLFVTLFLSGKVLRFAEPSR